MDGLNLYCEYLEAPVGVQNDRPRFSWHTDATRAAQHAYRIRVREENGAEVWDSGCMEEWRSFGIEYAGVPLKSETRYQFDVTAELADGSAVYGQSSFETGRFSEDDWRGEWISQPEHARGCSILLRRTFDVDVPTGAEHPLRRARLYISGIGYNIAWLNGETVSDNALDPGWTDYRKTILYTVFDVTDKLRPGANTIGVELGEGWLGNDHDGFSRMVGGQRLPWLNTPMARLDLMLERTDGSREYISTDAENWLCCPGEITFNSIYDGETRDARLRRPGWTTPDYIPDGDWRAAVSITPPGGTLVSQLMPPIRPARRIKPVYANYGQGQNVIFDMGENIAGWAEVRAAGKAGQRVVLRYAEVLDGNGELDTRTLRAAKNTDTFILADEGVETYAPSFTYHGFRYVEVSMDSGVLIYGLEGIVAHNAVKPRGEFSCSVPMLNRIQDVVLRTETNNLHGVPTDCPQRDERFGWLNDMVCRSEAALYNFDMALFYEKWMRDIADGQDASTGSIQDAAPGYFTGPAASHPSSVYVLIPWYLYKIYGDRQCMRRHYEGMKRYVDYKLSQRDANGLVDGRFFGEWTQPMTECVLGWGENALSNTISQQVGTTGYLYQDLCMMSEMAEVLGNAADAARFDADADAVCESFRRALVDTATGRCDKGSQGAQAFALYLGLIPENVADKALAIMIDDIVKRGYHSSTGNQLTKYLYECLNLRGRNDVALRLARQTTYPSIGYMLEHGATALWERWEEMTGDHMNSHDHPMQGSFTVWFYKALGGLDVRAGLSDERIVLRPDFVEGVDFASAALDIPRGRVSVRWTRLETGDVDIEIGVPWNAEAALELPRGYTANGEQSVCLTAGKHNLRISKDI